MRIRTSLLKVLLLLSTGMVLVTMTLFKNAARQALYRRGVEDEK